ncbi:DNA internalization-related competence protein ComEC/Rec2 [Candidatus Latescibacterota bacterium]
MENLLSIEIKKPLAGPACRSVLVFSAGILFCGLFRPDLSVLLGILIPGILFLFMVPKNKKAGNTVAVAVLFFSGMFACSVQHEIQSPFGPMDQFVNRDVIIEGVLTGSARHHGNSTSFELKCVSLHYDGSFYPANGILPCTLYDKKIILPEGSHIVVPGKIRKQLQPIERTEFSTLMRKNKVSSNNSYYRLTAGVDSANPVIVEERVSFFGSMREYISGLIDRYPFGGYDGLLRAMTIGDKSGLTYEIRNDFSKSGISHILAVSGLHVGILLIAIQFVLGLFPVSRGMRFIVTISLLFVYCGICSFRPPVVRTFIMTTMVMAGLFFERRKDFENSLFVALLIILAYNPQSLYNPSLQLSFAAVWAIVTFYTPLMNPVRERLKQKSILNSVLTYFISVLIVSALAFTATAPVVAAHFGSLPLLSVIVNVPAVILAVVIVITGMVSLFFIALGPVAGPVAAVLSSVTGVLLHLLSTLADFVANIPFSSVETGGLSSFVAISFLAWLFVLSKAKGREKFKKSLLYIPLALMLFFSWSPLVYSGWHVDGRGTVFFFNVGQGDSALIEYNDKRYFLVDTGITSATEDVVVPSLKNMGIDKLDGIFISHLDTDHIGGLDYILKNVSVQRIFCRESAKDSLGTIYGNRVTGISAGDSISFEEGGIFVLSPFLSDAIFEKYGISGENNNSLVLRFEIYGSKILFSGDIEEKVQQSMVSWDSRLNSSIMKVPHHGAETLSEAFVNTSNPLMSVISCGLNNSYGHPAESTVRMLENKGISVLRTDREGTIVIEFPQLDVVSY